MLLLIYLPSSCYAFKSFFDTLVLTFMIYKVIIILIVHAHTGHSQKRGAAGKQLVRVTDRELLSIGKMVALP